MPLSTKAHSFVIQQSTLQRSRLEVPDYPTGDKNVVLPAFTCVDIQLGYARPEVAYFSPHSKIVEDPNIQPKTNL
jgi:hypothetical protein